MGGKPLSWTMETLLRASMAQLLRWCTPLALGTSWILVSLAPLAAQEPSPITGSDEISAGQLVLRDRCLECHAGAEPAGALDLTSAETLGKGGESGQVVVAGQPDTSLLWQRVADDEMPPKHPLSAQERTALRDWIAAGAAWVGGSFDPLRNSTDRRAGYDWWSLQPIVPGESDADELAPSRVLDRLVDEQRTAAGLSPSPRADARALLRRVYFDLIGLPPTPEQMADFLRDPSDEAYERIVDLLLASPAYGERWGRHWLDVVRFGESDGFERNMPRENAWPYRDWVIQAFNADMPYDQFVREQLAGDLLHPGADGAAAAGFLVAGLHNTVVGGSERMRRLARQDELEEVIGTIGQTFLGLTVNCARCHDHKFDPLTSREYYQFVALIDGMDHGEVELLDAAVSVHIDAAERSRQEILQALSEIDQPARARLRAARGQTDHAVDTQDVPQPIAAWDFTRDLQDACGSLHGKPQGGAAIQGDALILDGVDDFVETSPLNHDLAEKSLEVWLTLDNLEQRGGAAISIQTLDGNQFDAIVFGEQEPARWMAGSDLFQRTQSFGGPSEQEAAAEPVHFVIVYDSQGSIQAYRNGAAYGAPYQTTPVRFPAGQAQILFGLRHSPAGGNRLLAGRIHRAALYDVALSSAQVAQSSTREPAYISESELLASLDAETRQRRDALATRASALEKDLVELRSRQRTRIYTVKPSDPGPMHLHPRGSVAELGEAVAPAGLTAVPNSADSTRLAGQPTDRQRRLFLAEWITDPLNPLFPRVIVNRVWHYHFGRGLVETPNDFGFNGGRPSHPNLLDWLAAQLQRQGYRLKPLHRMIVTSETYRQSSRLRADAHAQDADNQLLWRFTPQRLDAESLRDAILVSAGRLHDAGGGPGFRDVTVEYNDGTTFFEPMAMSQDLQLRRRTVYRFTPRGGRSTLLDSFDCPDPSATAPRRSVTTTPLQALSLLNSSFVLTLAQEAAESSRERFGGDRDAAVRHAWHAALGRAPEAEELKWSTELVESQGIAGLYRALWNTNEFVMVE